MNTIRRDPGLELLGIHLWQRVLPGSSPVVHSSNSVQTANFFVHYRTQHGICHYFYGWLWQCQNKIWKIKNMLFCCAMASLIINPWRSLQRILTRWIDIWSKNCVLCINPAEFLIVCGEFNFKCLDASANTKKRKRVNEWFMFSYCIYIFTAFKHHTEITSTALLLDKKQYLLSLLYNFLRCHVHK